MPTSSFSSLARPGTPLPTGPVIPLTPHYDVTSNSGGSGGHGAGHTAASVVPPAYLRLIQPDWTAAKWADASYLRLGQSPGADESSIIVKDVPVTETTVQSVSAITPQDSVKSTQDKIDKGQAVSTDKTFVNQSQKTQEVTLNKPATRQGPNTLGILASTSGDLQIHTRGAAYMKFEDGHSTQVTSKDSRYDVKAGKLYASGFTGVNITAGTSSQPADLELTAYNYIKQTAYGPLSEETWGDSHKITHGDSWDKFYGNKHSWFQGTTESWTLAAEVSGKMSTSMTMFFGNANTIKLSVDFNLIMGGSINILLAAKMDFVCGLDFKLVLVSSIKFVYGWDLSFLSSGYKNVTGNDMKFVFGNDGKFVAGNDWKMVQAISSSIVGIKMDKNFDAIEVKDMGQVFEKLGISNKMMRSEVGQIEFKTKQMLNIT